MYSTFYQRLSFRSAAHNPRLEPVLQDFIVGENNLNWIPRPAPCRM